MRGIAAAAAPSLRAAVVGAGPAGLYLCDRLLTRVANAEVDVVEALPAPFGLVRYGVAPDHQDTKRVQNKFNAVLGNPRVRLFGNVALAHAAHAAAGQPYVTLEELRERYGAVILATGAPDSRALGVPNEGLDGVVSARDFVGWYNGHPSYAAAVDPALLQSARDVVVFGLGNVGLDMARLLIRGVANGGGLARTDVADHALGALVGNGVRRVTFVGRRGVPYAAFTAKELREFANMDGVASLRLWDGDVPHDAGALADEDRAGLQASRIRRRCYEVLTKRAGVDDAGVRSGVDVDVRGQLSPLRFDGDGDGRVRGVRLRVNAMDGPPDDRRAVPADPPRELTLPCDLALVSVGYVGRSPGGVALPMDDRRGTVEHALGRVSGAPGVYVCGWLKRGATGIIGTNLTDAEETAESVLADHASGSLAPAAARAEDLGSLLAGRGPSVDFAGWRRLESHEESLGLLRGSPRVKLASAARMLAVAHGSGP